MEEEIDYTGDYRWVQDENGNWIIIKKSLRPKSSSLNEYNILNKNKQKVLDNTELFAPGSFVMTEWGVGKIVGKVDENIVSVQIEGNQVEFPKEQLTTYLPIYLCILCRDTTNWAEIRIEFRNTIETLKNKIALFMRCHPSQVIVIHNGIKIDKKNLNLTEIGIYEKDVILIAIKDPQELSIIRTKGTKCQNTCPMYNALKFTVDHDIVITGIGFFKNKNMDVCYSLFIYEEAKGSNNRSIFSDKKILVTKDENEESEVFHFKINNLEIKKNTLYQIHQNLNGNYTNQFVGVKGSETVEEKNTLINFKFFKCEITGKTNSTDLEEGMIPIIYFFVRNEN